MVVWFEIQCAGGNVWFRGREQFEMRNTSIGRMTNTAVLQKPTGLNFWHPIFTFNSNKSPTLCNNFSVYYPDVCLQLNMFRAFFLPSSGAQ
jgi:hypothetical protein